MGLTGDGLMYTRSAQGSYGIWHHWLRSLQSQVKTCTVLRFRFGIGTESADELSCNGKDQSLCVCECFLNECKKKSAVCIVQLSCFVVAKLDGMRRSENVFVC